jgi:ZIP family zinc transporter
VIEAFLLGAVAQSSLVLSGILPYLVRIPDRVVGLLAGAGAGALISAVAFDLIPEANAISGFEVAVWLLVGAVIFIGLDRLIDMRFGAGGEAGPLGIVLGAVVDGIPESVIFGIQIGTGLPISVAFLAAVIVSNVPQALAPSADLKADGWSIGRMTAMWGTVVLACGIAAAAGYFVATTFDPSGIGARAAAIAAGGLLAMLTNSLVPFAYERGGIGAGLATVVGFVAALAMT